MTQKATGTSLSFVSALLLVAGLAFSACGDSGGGATDAGPDRNCDIDGTDCTTGDGCCSENCDPILNVCTAIPGSCITNGSACTVGPDCCSFSCIDGTCSDEQCTSDGEACTDGAECCGGSCEGDVCVPLNAECKTSGNVCAEDNDCCSSYCNDGLCDSSPSFCTQTGDACSNDFECCAGLCDNGGDGLGTCIVVPGPGAGGCITAGEVCGADLVDGEPPVCGGECCSRACFPFGPTGIYVCQPPSGCNPTGELCREDNDCCGSATQPDGESANVTCSKVDGNPIGRCDAGNSCTPAGGICRLQSQSCNENANCCAGNVLQNDTCKQDSLGIPRCVIAEIDCTDPSAFEGEDCATSADCCGLPCTPSGTGEFPPLTCGGACSNEDGVCTTTADCCTGSCILEPGATSGTCGTPNDCAEVGQACTVAEDCCSDVPCNDGICGVVIIID